MSAYCYKMSEYGPVINKLLLKTFCVSVSIQMVP